MPRKKGSGKPDNLTPIETSEQGRALSARRKRGPGACVVCGRPWKDGLLSKQYCSDSCKLKAARRRKKPLAP